MNHQHLYFWLITLLLAPALPAAEPPGAIEGHYLAENFLRSLEKTHSRVESAAKAEPLAIEVVRKPEGYMLTVTNYHEALHYLIRDARLVDGKVEMDADPTHDESDATTPITFVKSPDSEDLLAGALWSEIRLGYRKLPGTVAETVNTLTIAGSYVDKEGKSYVFEPNGDGIWAGQKMRYEVSVDSTFPDECDSIYSPGPASARPDGFSTTGFRRLQDGKLGLYHLIDTEEITVRCQPEPFTILTPSPKP